MIPLYLRHVKNNHNNDIYILNVTEKLQLRFECQIKIQFIIIVSVLYALCKFPIYNNIYLHYQYVIWYTYSILL